jgi:hypothetical protein
MSIQSRLAIVAVITLAAIGATGDYAIVPDVVGSGATVATSADYAIGGTVGQIATGIAYSSSYALCSGFWCRGVPLPSIPIPGTNTRLVYSFTFGQMAIGSAALLLLVVMGARQVYDLAMAMRGT